MSLGTKSCFILASFFSLTCSSSRPSSGGDKPAVRMTGEAVAPGDCRVVATVVSIDPEMKSNDPKSPCSRAPCVAIVRVDSVLGYGSGVQNPLAVGKLISVWFAFTLSPTTKDLFPNMTDSFPGLNVGSSFLADFTENSVQLDKEGSKSTFTVYGYKTRNY